MKCQARCCRSVIIPNSKRHSIIYGVQCNRKKFERLFLEPARLAKLDPVNFDLSRVYRELRCIAEDKCGRNLTDTIDQLRPDNGSTASIF
jgi:hypothetical protein